ncbi:MAG: flagellar export chaperone FlgN [Actinomycetota bacterium]|jgi:hypothetical protein|nr:flagellar export chaperone FlgN [Actinomycetota bacterium]
MEVARDENLEALAGAVAAESDALGQLRFKFEVQQVMLSGGRSAYLDETTRELEAAIAAVQHADAIFRQRLSSAAVDPLGLSPESTLREVAAAAGEPWRYIFEQGRADLRRAVEAIGRLRTENRKLLARGYLATSEALALLGVDTAGMSYDASGAPQRGRAAATILNRRA